MRIRKQIPSLRHHKPSGQDVVTLGGKDFYCGPHGTRVARDAYDRFVGEWLAAGRAVPARQTGLLVADLIDAFVSAETLPASHAHDYRTVMRLLLRLYGPTLAAEFGPLALRAVRDRWVSQGLRRGTINARVLKIRRIFRWGVGQQLLEASVIQALEAVDGLAAGKSAATESVPVQAVEQERVESLLKLMPPMLAAMVQLQLCTGMRAAELCQLRPCDIDTTGYVWVYRPAKHKTQHKGKLREVSFGPRAIAILQPMLPTDLQAYVFSPARGEAERLAAVHAARTTPLSCGNRPRARVRKYADRYTTASYRQAIERIIARAFPPPETLARQRGETDGAWRKRLGAKKWAEVLAWRTSHRWTPHRLRHTFAERVRDEFGLDHAQVALGHSHARVTEVYAKANRSKAAEVAAAIG